MEDSGRANVQALQRERECTKMFTTGLPDKLGSALYLFLT